MKTAAALLLLIVLIARATPQVVDPTGPGQQQPQIDPNGPGQQQPQIDPTGLQQPQIDPTGPGQQQPQIDPPTPTPPPPPPVPSPQQPQILPPGPASLPACPMQQQPFCRVYIRGATCCQGQGIAVPSFLTNILFVCSANVRLPQEKCFNITGPANVTTYSVLWGGIPDFGDMSTYDVDWRNSNFAPGINAPFNGTVVVDYESLRSKDSDCDLTLPEPCTVNGAVYTKAAPVNATRINVVGNTTRLPPLPGLAWTNSTLGPNGCLSQLYVNLPPTFYGKTKDAVGFFNGTTVQCSPVSA